MAFHDYSHLFKWDGLGENKATGGKKVCFLGLLWKCQLLFILPSRGCDASIFTFNFLLTFC